MSLSKKQAILSAKKGLGPSKDPLLIAAQTVGRSARLIGIRLIGGSFSRATAPDAARKPTSTSEIEIHVQRNGNQLSVQLVWAFDSGLKGVEPVALLVHVGATYLLQYELNPEMKFTDVQADAFARINGLLNSWPYWREHLQTTLLRMELPPLTLPLLKADQALEIVKSAQPAARKR